MNSLQGIKNYERKIKSLEKSNDFQIKLKRKMKLKHKKAYEFQAYLRKKYVRQITRLSEAIRVDEKLMNRMTEEHTALLFQMSEMAKENVRLLSKLNP
tara:strand:+ start:116 stop:409 length:294 start_codon:yes stop_codon:yes gene_type:complete